MTGRRNDGADPWPAGGSVFPVVPVLGIVFNVLCVHHEETACFVHGGGACTINNLTGACGLPVSVTHII